METIMILVNALAKAAHAEVSRLDIQYNTISELYSGRVWLDNTLKLVFDVCEDGTITKVKKTEVD